MDNFLTIQPTKNPNQKALDASDAFLARIVPTWYQPPTFDANAWRRVVASQEIAVICRETLIASILALDWKITAKDSSKQDELAGNIRYYTNLITNANGLEYTDHVEFVASDLLDTPFGSMSEIGRDQDKPNGRVRWIMPIDAATLYPTLNKEFPVMQFYAGKQVAFPNYAIAHVGMTPRTRIEQTGWYIAPPEKIFMALQMLSRGDGYYSNLLLDIPTAGVLDLGDMEKDSALEWVEAQRAALLNGGNGSFKIPVLYEHNTDVKYVSFGKVPNDIMFDKITLRYAAIICAGYGMTLSDIGIQTTSSGGETMAGTIRSERKTRRNGFARLKAKLKAYFQQILPPELQFSWIDFDDEVNAALGRARLANSSAFSLLKKDGIVSPAEIRQQMIADGMFTISMPEKPPADAVADTKLNAPAQAQQTPPQQRKPNILGNPRVPPSKGGFGEVTTKSIDPLAFRAGVAQVIEFAYNTLYEIRSNVSADELYIARSAFEDSVGAGSFDAPLHGVTFGLEMPDEWNDTVKRSILLVLENILLGDEGIDFGDSEVYDSILDNVTKNLLDSVEIGE